MKSWSERYLGFDWDDKEKRRSYLWELSWQWGLIIFSLIFLIIYNGCSGGVDSSTNYDVYDVQDRGNVDSGNGNNKDFTGVDSLDFGKEDKILPDIFEAVDNVGDIPCVPSGPEVCDGIDSDCDGETDEEWGVAPQGFGCKNLGVCQGYMPVCSGGQWTCIYPNEYEVEEKTCDDKDNDCDGETDEEILNCCESGETKNCGTDVGECEYGQKICDENGKWSKCEGGILPSQEICDEKDNDCDGKVDNNALDCVVYFADKDSDGFGVSNDFVCLCHPATPYVIETVEVEDCNDNDNLFHPGAQPDCKNGCSNGTLDEGEECDDGNFVVDDGCDLCGFSYFPMVTYSFPTKELPPAFDCDWSTLGGCLPIKVISYLEEGASFALIWREQMAKEGTPDVSPFFPVFNFRLLDQNLKPFGAVRKFLGSKEAIACRSFDARFINGKIYIVWVRMSKLGNKVENEVLVDVFKKEGQHLERFNLNVGTSVWSISLTAGIFPLVKDQMYIQLRSGFDLAGPGAASFGRIIDNKGNTIKDFSCYVENMWCHCLVLPDFNGKNLIYVWDEIYEYDEQYIPKLQWHAVWYDVESESEVSDFTFQGIEEKHSFTIFVREGDNLVLLSAADGKNVWAEIYDRNGVKIKEKTNILSISDPYYLFLSVFSLTYPANKFLIGGPAAGTGVCNSDKPVHLSRINFATGVARKFSPPCIGEEGEYTERALAILDENTAVFQQYVRDSYGTNFVRINF